MKEGKNHEYMHAKIYLYMHAKLYLYMHAKLYLYMHAKQYIIAQTQSSHLAKHEHKTSIRKDIHKEDIDVVEAKSLIHNT